jgi:hypothetical protein
VSDTESSCRVVPWYLAWQFNILKLVGPNFSSCSAAIALYETTSDSVEMKFHFLLLFRYPQRFNKRKWNFPLVVPLSPNGSTAGNKIWFQHCQMLSRKGSWNHNMLKNYDQQISGCCAVMILILIWVRPGVGCPKGVSLWPLNGCLITIHLASPWSWNLPSLKVLVLPETSDIRHALTNRFYGQWLISCPSPGQFSGCGTPESYKSVFLVTQNRFQNW